MSNKEKSSTLQNLVRAKNKSIIINNMGKNMSYVDTDKNMSQVDTDKNKYYFRMSHTIGGC